MEECRAGDEGVQAGKAEEWIGPKGNEPETGDRDWAVGSERSGCQSAEEKIFQLNNAYPSKRNLQPVPYSSTILMFRMGIQAEGRITNAICDKVCGMFPVN